MSSDESEDPFLKRIKEVLQSAGFTEDDTEGNTEEKIWQMIESDCEDNPFKTLGADPELEECRIYDIHDIVQSILKIKHMGTDHVLEWIAEGRNGPPPVEDTAVTLFRRIASSSESGEYSADKMREDTAKGWASGAHKSYEAKGPNATHLMAGKGGGVQNMFDTLCATLESAKELDSYLSEASLSTEDAANIWDAYDTATDRLFPFIRTIRDKLKEDAGIRKYIKSNCKTIFTEQIKIWEVLGPRLVSVVVPKLESDEKKEKVKVWGPKTLGYMQDCFNNASL